MIVQSTCWPWRTWIHSHTLTPWCLGLNLEILESHSLLNGTSQARPLGNFGCITQQRKKIYLNRAVHLGFITIFLTWLRVLSFKISWGTFGNPCWNISTVSSISWTGAGIPLGQRGTDGPLVMLVTHPGEDALNLQGERWEFPRVSAGFHRHQ